MLLILAVLLFYYVTGAMDSANLDDKRVGVISEEMKDLQIRRREKIFPYPVEDIKFLEILKSKLYIAMALHIKCHNVTLQSAL